MKRCRGQLHDWETSNRAPLLLILVGLLCSIDWCGLPVGESLANLQSSAKTLSIDPRSVRERSGPVQHSTLSRLLYSRCFRWCKTLKHHYSREACRQGLSTGRESANEPKPFNHSPSLALCLFFCVFVYTFVHSNFNQKRKKDRKKKKTRVGNVFHLPNNSSTLLLRKRNCRNGEMVRLLMN